MNAGLIITSTDDVTPAHIQDVTRTQPVLSELHSRKRIRTFVNGRSYKVTLLSILNDLYISSLLYPSVLFLSLFFSFFCFTPPPPLPPLYLYFLLSLIPHISSKVASTPTKINPAMAGVAVAILLLIFWVSDIFIHSFLSSYTFLLLSFPSPTPLLPLSYPSPTPSPSISNIY